MPAERLLCCAKRELCVRHMALLLHLHAPGLCDRAHCTGVRVRPRRCAGVYTPASAVVAARRAAVVRVQRHARGWLARRR